MRPCTLTERFRMIHIGPRALGIALATLMGTQTGGGRETVTPAARVIVAFADDSEKDRWTAVNDGVMGGLSQGAMELSPDGTAVFRGALSLENNGGFASVRRAPHDYELSGYSGVKIRVRGDGRTYQFRVRTDDRLDGVAYRAEFRTVAGEWLTIELPFDSFVPTFHGRTVADAPALDPARVRQLGFLIADKEQGVFRLEIEWIQACATPAPGDATAPAP